MEKEEEHPSAPAPPPKKKKNKGWNSNNPTTQEGEPTSQPQISQSPLNKEIEGLAISQDTMIKLDCQPKSLSQMSKTYHIEMGLELGSGFASVVYLGQNIHTNQVVCVKVIDYLALGGQTAKKILNRQIKYLNHFDSHHIVRLIDVFESISFCYLIMEYCEGGDLYKFMVKSEVLHPLFVRKIIQQICLGLAELKTKELIHRDLKTENIFLTRNFQAKIGDLGFCVTTTEENVIHNVGSPIYMSPEVLNGGAHSFESDIYGLGVIWYELLHKTAPWLAKTEAELLQKKLKEKVEFPRSDLAETDRALIERCLSIDPKERCSVEQVLQYCQSVNKSEMSALQALKEKQGVSEFKGE